MPDSTRNPAGLIPSVAPKKNGNLEPLRKSAKVSRKRRRKLSPSLDSDSADSEEYEVSRRHTQPAPSAPNRSLACPFYKLDPRQHPQCARLMLSKMSYVKQHLTRRHPPCIHCSRCYEIFEKNEDFTEHQRRDPPCKLQPKKDLPGMTDEQMNKLKCRSNQSQNEVGQWEEIWKILFPNMPPPASVYIDLDISEEVNELRDYMALYVPPRIVDTVAQREASGQSESSEDLARDVMELVVEVADQWILEQRRRNASPEKYHNATPLHAQVAVEIDSA